MDPNQAFRLRNAPDLGWAKNALIKIKGETYVRFVCKNCESATHVTLYTYSNLLSKGADYRDIDCYVCNQNRLTPYNLYRST